MTHLDEQAVADLRWGAAVLGAGGGGDTYLVTLAARQAVRESGPVPLLAPHELDDDALVIPVACMGSPTIVEEKLPGRTPLVSALHRLEHHLGRKADAVIPVLAGGMACPCAVATAAVAGVPLVDADGAGRAVSELHMTSFCVYGLSASPFVLVNERGDTTIIEALDELALERVARAVTYRYGGWSYVAGFPLQGRQVKETAVLYTISFAVRLGEQIRAAGHDRDAMLAAINGVTTNSTYGPCHVLVDGRVVAVERPGGRASPDGSVLVQNQYGRMLQIHFQNEFLLAEAEGRTVASVPDLITVIDTETLQPVQADSLVYGQRVVVTAIPIPGMMRTTEALRYLGPRYFGYDLDYQPLEATAAGAHGG